MLLSIKLKNQIKAIQSDNLEFYLKNISINGAKQGCSGFIKNTLTGNVVYVNTEKSCYQPLSTSNLYRIARDLRDYKGGQNRWSSDNDIASDVVNLLKVGGM
jgi:hypothetical protein